MPTHPRPARRPGQQRSQRHVRLTAGLRLRANLGAGQRGGHEGSRYRRTRAQLVVRASSGASRHVRLTAGLRLRANLGPGQRNCEGLAPEALRIPGARVQAGDGLFPNSGSTALPRRLIAILRSRMPLAESFSQAWSTEMVAS